MRHIILILSLFISFGALAGETTYICKIAQVLELSNNGELVKHNGVYKSLIGEKFTIDRDSGDMIGLPFSTKSYKQITVLDKGSKEMSYKSIVLSHPPNRWVMYIQVKEFTKGKLKPFWGTEGGNIFSGQCE